MPDTYPTHYLDGENRGVCPCSGTPRTDNQPCSRGCGGATEHYTNDGHPECEETEKQ